MMWEVFEEINVGLAGGNYGWPAVEHGPQQRSEFMDPIHRYPQASIAGGDFCAETPLAGGSTRPIFLCRFRCTAGLRLDTAAWRRWRRSPPDCGGPVDWASLPMAAFHVLLWNAWVIDDKFEGHRSPPADEPTGKFQPRTLTRRRKAA